MKLIMKCDKCGFTPNPGDQICINCGAKLSLQNVIIPEVEISNVTTKVTNSKKIIIITIISITLGIIIIYLIIKFLIIK